MKKLGHGAENTRNAHGGTVTKKGWGASLVGQWLILQDPSAGGPGSIPIWGTRSRMPQLKTLHAISKTWCSQINKYFNKQRVRTLSHRQQEALGQF